MSDCADIQAENDALIKALDREEQKVVDLEAQLAESQRREKLLRAVAEAAELFRKSYYLPKDTSVPALRAFVKLQDVLLTAEVQAAIDGGALEEGK